MIEILLYGIAFDGVGGDVFLWMVVVKIVVEIFFTIYYDVHYFLVWLLGAGLLGRGIYYPFRFLVTISFS